MNKERTDNGSLMVPSKAKRKREEDQEKIERTNNNINKYFKNGPVTAAPKPKVGSASHDCWCLLTEHIACRHC